MRLPCRVASAAVLALAASTGAHAASYLAKHCADLEGKEVPASVIGLPTRGATIWSASVVKAAAPGNRNGEYCRIVGSIKAVQDNTPDIRFEVNLPSRWNGRALQMGGGGYSGVLVSGTEPMPFAPDSTPLAKGYATFGSDSGHVGNSGRADFAANDEAILNFGFGHLKKTHDVALALIQLGYGRNPDKTYFAGGSTGGREGFTVAERYPNDYDGVIANAPAINFSGVRLMGVKVGQASYGKPGGFVGLAQQRRVIETVQQECDKLDNAADGIVSNVEACRKLEPKIIADLRCANGQRPSLRDSCLSDAQLATLNTLRDGLNLPYLLAFGVDTYPGYNVYQGVDFSGVLGLGDSPVLVNPPGFAVNGYLFAQGDAYIKHFVTRDLTYNSIGFDIANPGRYRQRLMALSATVGAMNTDLTGFIARGGKLIAMHGLADEVISPNQTIAFYRLLVDRFTQDGVDAFMRLYMVPGFQHGNGVFIPAWDELGALDRWVTDGIAPETLVGTDIAPTTNGRSRPMCRYPAYPRYIGRGSIDNAANFRCVYADVRP
ncbi:tannase and feruloyl esterase [Caballeronia arationis]|jgi:feruloyl esterase|uniref:Feruloyl esterase n=1 Tax=Caballeronia arationis TaxID=1777142 RepID=A0A7Z7I9B5_9BURK|nr:tannase/feruloyl esterase family alpha/beta hydrolase [Caballeronia arationis]SAL02830.1 tannase and feruloyl esterase [Caballeronia arationis]SOE81679.1 feruloyl esterase [Caballeronia arationis]